MGIASRGHWLSRAVAQTSSKPLNADPGEPEVRQEHRDAVPVALHLHVGPGRDVFLSPDKASAAADPIESGQARAIAIAYNYAPGSCYMGRKSLQRFVPCRRSMTEVQLNPVLLRHAIPTFGALKKNRNGFET